MTSEKLYYRQNVLAEPLVNQWYAWSYLVSPATAAMYIANSHLKIMQSFVATPQVHISALKNPAMMGGPFINYDLSKTGKIKYLVDKTVREQGHMLEFAEAVKTLDDLLKTEATGLSLEPLYPKVPEALRGYVELVYDLNNNPSIRFIESLLYRSKYANRASQSIEFSLADKDERAFIFSTPRLSNPDRLHLNIPLDHTGLDELFRMKQVPQTYDYIKDALQIDSAQDELFSQFFTRQSPKQCTRYAGEGVRIRYFGHACLLVETKEVSIITDPVISYHDHIDADRFTYTDLPEVVDYMLLTHNHQDHVMFETLLQLRHKVKNVIVPRNNGGSLADPSLKLTLQSIGFKNVYEIDEMETVEVADGRINSLPFFGEHADLNVRAKTAFLLDLKGRTILCAADSNNIEPRLYEHLHELTGDMDVIFVGMECDGAPMNWLYGPLTTKPLARKMDQSRRLDGSNHEKAMALINQFHPKEVYIYAMGQEPWLTYLTSIQYTEQSRPITESDKVVEDCRRTGIKAERLFCIKELHL